MTSLYNCKHSGDQYRISKFDSDWNLEASYLCDLSTCECPAGHRPKCRHREMLPKFIQRNYVNTEWFWDHDRGGWVQGWKEEPLSKTDILNDMIPLPYTEDEALPIQQMVVEHKTFNEMSHEHDEEQLAFYREAAGLGQASEQGPSPSPPLPSPTIRRRV